MASNALGLFSFSPFPFILRSQPGRSKLIQSFSINPSRTVRSAQTIEKQSRNLEQEDHVTSLKHFFEEAKSLVTSDVDGQPRWFSPVDCGQPLHNSPLLLFLPGIDGTGLGLIKHHQKLGKIFKILCLHIPSRNRTPFAVLVKLVERKIQSEHFRRPNRPIYLVGESIGACLALSVASLNPDIDLVLILANPATSFSRSPLQPVLSLLQFIPESPNLGLPHILSSMAGAIMATLEKGVETLSLDLVAPSVSYLSVLADIIPMETLLWKLQMISSASLYTNSRLHAIKAQTLILSSGRDSLLSSQEEGQRLRLKLENSEIRTFEDCGHSLCHSLFLENAFDLVTVIKNTGIYRRSKVRDFVSDYIPLSPSEEKKLLDNYRWISTVMSPVMLSTLADGKIVRGFAGIPSEGPVLYVGYHMLLGIDVVPMIAQFMEQKDIHLRGITHPMMFMKLKEGHVPVSDDFRLVGAVPVSGKNLFKLLSTKSHVLLYPGGVREALHRKGEAYKLFWPEQSEFVRMAAKFGAKIVPFGAVGEDDWGDILFDYEDQMKVSFLRKYNNELSDKVGKLRATVDGEVGNQPVHIPAVLLKIPGRNYYCFGKPLETEGRKQELRDRKKAHELYLQVKSEVEKCIAYLQEKRESDPYRSLVSRIPYHATHGFTSEVPSFDLD